MKRTALLFLVVSSLLAACTSTRDEMGKAAVDRTPIVHNTIVDCPVYDGMKKTSTVLAQTTSGNEVQVTDTINAYFVRVRLEKDGQTKVGYMDRRCFGERGNERGNRKMK
ncbi:hypothetical protein [Hymenobacter siberiensis]|jgi:hypothetical protein|uniref:hypothetical protein n=1 Tax=Hymenobacter siberiensis TaxID=2848396 RepID=UPI001C1E24F9|nr:hypothetical protein [Hymenobacter siberiensis]MBU6120105.1 hypothetical protein [Hymenobacter siberiensis]